MKQTLSQESFPLFSMELNRAETSFQSADEIIDYFKQCIEQHPYARFIAEFDHLSHTQSLPEGSVLEGIQAAKNIVFCFGITLPDPRHLANRPRSIGVAETQSGFIITFMEAPMPVANAAMETWTRNLRNQQVA